VTITVQLVQAGVLFIEDNYHCATCHFCKADCHW